MPSHSRLAALPYLRTRSLLWLLWRNFRSFVLRGKGKENRLKLLRLLRSQNLNLQFSSSELDSVTPPAMTTVAEWPFGLGPRLRRPLRTFSTARSASTIFAFFDSNVRSVRRAYAEALRRVRLKIGTTRGNPEPVPLWHYLRNALNQPPRHTERAVSVVNIREALKCAIQTATALLPSCTFPTTVPWRAVYAATVRVLRKFWKLCYLKSNNLNLKLKKI